jgi:hypothetical protein
MVLTQPASQMAPAQIAANEKNFFFIAAMQPHGLHSSSAHLQRPCDPTAASRIGTPTLVGFGRFCRVSPVERFEPPTLVGTVASWTLID